MNRGGAACVVAAALAGAQMLQAQAPPKKPLRPVDAITAVIEAFADHDIVTLSDPHGHVLQQRFLITLIRDPRLPSVVNDIVLEGASARYQDALDRFVRGDAIDDAAVRAAWEDTTQPQAFGEAPAEMIRTIRAVNRMLPAERRMRVLAGDPPIDWTNVTTNADHSQWIRLRDTYPGDLIHRRVVDQRRKALVIYGQMHAQRLQAFSNYEMSTWEAQTVVSILLAARARVFNVWTLFGDRPIPAEMRAWSPPSLARLADTPLGAEDFASYAVIPNRFGLRNGVLAPLPRAEWKPLPFQEQFDAVLYLGPAEADSLERLSPQACADRTRVDTRIARIGIAGLPAVEIEQIKTACGL